MDDTEADLLAETIADGSLAMAVVDAAMATLRDRGLVGQDVLDDIVDVLTAVIERAPQKTDGERAVAAAMQRRLGSTARAWGVGTSPH